MKPASLAIGILLLGVTTLGSQPGKDDWQSVFPDKKTLGVKGSNPYYILTPGYQLSYKHGDGTITDTVLNETKVIDGVETRVIEDRETRKGQLIEATRDYYAIDSVTNDVYYFGEDIDVYKNGKVAGHEGAWLSGVNGAKFGMMMPAKPRVGQKFYQELAPKVAMDRAEIVSDKERIETPAGVFENCVKVHETSGLKKGDSEYKWYAAGVGPVKDAEMLLVKYGK
jgi:hypothetical protein